MPDHEWYMKNRPRILAESVARTRNIKTIVLRHYSGGAMCCAHCRYDNTDALFLDHINHDGGEQRKRLFGSVNGGGSRFYLWLVGQGLPPGFQVLCANCNWLKEIERRREKRRRRASMDDLERLL